MVRIWIALLGLPLVVLLLMQAAFAAWKVADAGAAPLADVGVEVIRYLMVAYPVALLLGVPALGLALWRRWFGWPQALALGAAVGVLSVIWLLLPLLFEPSAGMAERLHRLTWLAGPLLVGAGHGLLYWGLGFWRNPRVQPPLTA